MNAILVENLTKQYKNGVLALDGISLSVREGEIFSLLGPNGAGKSTLIGILTSYLKPDSGRITIFNSDMGREAFKIRSEIACVAQQISIDTHLSLEENMMFQGRLYKLSKPEAKKRMEVLIERFGLKEYEKYPVSSYSGGIKRRLDIALAMMSGPRILFLDEPTVGMDIKSRSLMWEMMKKIRDEFGITIFLTTHYLEEADCLSNTICIMRDGREAAQGTPYELRSYIRQDSIRIRFISNREAAEQVSRLRVEFPEKEMVLKDSFVILGTEDAAGELTKVCRTLLNERIPFLGIEAAQPSLNDIFLRLTATQKQEGCA